MSTQRQQHNQFDRFADDYTALLDKGVGISGFRSSFFDERKVAEMRAVLHMHGREASPLNILNFGCGIGKSEPYLVQSFPRAEITSLDISHKAIEVARQNNAGLPRVHFDTFDGHHIPSSHTYDVIMVAGVLHHIAPDERSGVIREFRRVLADNGFLFIFEHNPWNPVTRRIVQDCPFDEDAVLVYPRQMRTLLSSAGFTRSTVRFIHFFPSLLRILLPLEHILGWLPLGAQYFFVAQKGAFPA